MSDYVHDTPCVKVLCETTTFEVAPRVFVEAKTEAVYLPALGVLLVSHGVNGAIGPDLRDGRWQAVLVSLDPGVGHAEAVRATVAMADEWRGMVKAAVEAPHG